ncbi:ATP-binding protein [Delftia acidovorans]|uniref:ATP-binding protein n=1 Tax=Delftia acidovorans TaxID=80866 RepID=UPI00242A933C|nr:ATP-binding protein [Delftia acidovorans]
MKLSREERQWLASAVAIAQKDGGLRNTSWVLITGAPGSGKTTIAACMAAAGLRIIEDPGRAEFEHQLRNGVPPHIVRSDYHRFQHLVLKRALSIIDTIPDNEQVIFDYGVAESLAFMKIAGIPWDDVIVQAAARLHFKQVFLLDVVSLPLNTDDIIRAESEQSRNLLRDLFQEIYQVLGHNFIRVPLMSVKDRFEFINGLIEFPKSTVPLN